MHRLKWSKTDIGAKEESYFVWKYRYTWSPSMPLLTPLRRRGSTDPMLKEANYSQYLPHSREARSSRGQACETFLQPAAGPPSQLSLPLSSFLLLHPSSPASRLPPLLSVLFSIAHILYSGSLSWSPCPMFTQWFVFFSFGVHLFSHSSICFCGRRLGYTDLLWLKA